MKIFEFIRKFPEENACRHLGHNRYQPIWEIVNKPGDVMGKYDSM